VSESEEVVAVAPDELVSSLEELVCEESLPDFDDPP
jgi:hypothetical protein